MATAEQIRVANSTSRNMGAVGARAVVPRFVREHYGDLSDLRVLDFGAGKAAAHAQAMREAYSDVHGWTVDAVEFGENVGPEHLTGDERAHNRLTYGVVYASNVLNVQGDLNMLQQTLRDARSYLRTGGHFIANYPASPRKSDLTADDVEQNLKLFFGNVVRVAGTKAAPVFKCTRVEV